VTTPEPLDLFLYEATFADGVLTITGYDPGYD